MKKIFRYSLIAAASLATLAFLRQRRCPIPHPPRLSFLFENPVLDLTPGMRVLDAGCGPGRLTIPLARAVGPAGEIVALDGQPGMLAKLEERLKAGGITNVRPLRAGLGEGALQEGGFDRIVLAMVLGEVRDRASAVRELHAALGPGGILSVTEIFGDLVPLERHRRPRVAPRTPPVRRVP